MFLNIYVGKAMVMFIYVTNLHILHTTSLLFVQFSILLSFCLLLYCTDDDDDIFKLSRRLNKADDERIKGCVV